MQISDNIQPIYEIAIYISKEINNEIEYQLTINEFHTIRNSEYNKLISEGRIEDNDDNWNSFDTYLASLLNINWG